MLFVYIEDVTHNSTDDDPCEHLRLISNPKAFIIPILKKTNVVNVSTQINSVEIYLLRSTIGQGDRHNKS